MLHYTATFYWNNYNILNICYHAGIHKVAKQKKINLIVIERRHFGNESLYCVIKKQTILMHFVQCQCYEDPVVVLLFVSVCAREGVHMKCG